MAAVVVPFIKGVTLTSPNYIMAVSKHFLSFLPFIISPTPFLYYNFPFPLVSIFFSLFPL